MKTLHVDCGREMRGGQWQVLYLTEQLERATLMAPESSPLAREARARGLEVLPLSFGSLYQAARNADLVHVHDARAHSMAALAGGAPLVVARRVGFPMKRGFFADRKYSAARMYIAVSNYVAARLAERGIPAERIRVVYDGVPIPARASIATAGVVAILKTEREAILTAAESAGVPVRCVADLWQDLSTARVLAYWSEMEGLGSGALAAMASGVAVVARRVGGLAELIEHERTGLLVDRVEEIPAALRRLTENPREAAEMGARAREVAQQKFSQETMAAATVRVYGEVLG